MSHTITVFKLLPGSPNRVINIEPKIVDVTQLRAACQTIRDAKLDLFRAFWNKGYIDHGLRKNRIILDVTENGLYSCTIEGVPMFADGTIGGLLDKFELLLNASKDGKGKHSHHSCCILSQPRGCVCSYSQECVLHGSKCIGSHD